MASNNSCDTSYVSLLAAAPFIGSDCLDINKSFIECKQKDENPAACLSQGEKVTACTLKVLRVAEQKCSDSFSAYKACLHKNHKTLDACRKEQAAFEKCWASEE
mmetsp:Transcript_15451/g.17491  ORF Transcript_15451/g.17491 Transcript_15451/m.17491 type:complete len:104 (-) Transcript_15451:42-353(-)